jgi:RND family efflux transporter MFP subunit
MFIFQKILFFMGLLLSTLFFSACESKTEKNVIVEEVKPIAVKVHTLKKEAYPIWVDFSGKTQAVDEVMVISRVTGELKERFFKPGDTVKKDQILFRIDKREYQAIWDQKNAILQKDKASLNLANANVKRYKPLVEEQLAPREKLDELEATKQQLEATIKADMAALEAAMLDLEYCDVKASIAGQIGKELVLLGNIVNAGTELAKIVQTEFLYVNFNPSAHEVALIKKYKSADKPKVKVRLRSSKRMDVELEGEIDFIDNVSNTSTGTVAMRAKITNDKQLLFPCTFVELKLFVSDKLPVLAVHPDQISQNQQGEYVLVVNKKSEIETKQVQTSYTNNDLAIITDGLVEGDRVVVGTINALRNGTKVSVSEVENPINQVR